jgi:hypothetical protein
MPSADPRTPTSTPGCPFRDRLRRIAQPARRCFCYAGPRQRDLGSPGRSVERPPPFAMDDRPRTEVATPMQSGGKIARFKRDRDGVVTGPKDRGHEPQSCGVPCHGPRLRTIADAVRLAARWNQWVAPAARRGWCRSPTVIATDYAWVVTEPSMTGKGKRWTQPPQLMIQ